MYARFLVYLALCVFIVCSFVLFVSFFFLLFAVCIMIVFVIPTGANVYANLTLSWISADGRRVLWGAYLGHSPEVVEVAVNASLGKKSSAVAQEECLCVSSSSTGEEGRTPTTARPYVVCDFT